jgi:hypothetical protein
MPLVRKQPSGADAPLGDVLAEIGLDASHGSRGWVATIGDTQLFMSWIERGRVLAGYAPLLDAETPEELRELLERNLEPRLVWFSRGGTDPAGGLGARFALPLDPFDPAAVRLALAALAGAVGDHELAARAAPASGGEAAEQEAESDARERVEAALRRLTLDPRRDVERDGVWQAELRGRAVDAVLRDTGESLLLMHQLEYAAGDEDPEVLRWLLLASDWGSARLGLAPLPGGPGLFAACAVATTGQEPPLAWALEQLTGLADDYDARSGG